MKSEDKSAEESKAALEGEVEVLADTSGVNEETVSNFSPELLGRLWTAKTPTGQKGFRPGDLIEQARYEYVFEGSQATPNFFREAAGVDEDGNAVWGPYFDVKITMEALDSTKEIEALRGVTDPAQAPFMLAKACFVAINGTRFESPEQRDFFWEGLGMKGRSLAILAYNTLGSASESSLGKFQASFSAASR